MIHVLVIGAAPIPGEDAFYEGLLADAVRVVAADGGSELCRRAGRISDVVVGDLDSASAEAVEWARGGGAEVVAYAVDKDRTDLELAVAEALERFGAPVTITAAFSARVDHTLAAVGTLARAGAGACAREPGWSAWTVTADAPLSLDVPAETPFSVIAVGRAGGVTISGARWPLEQAELSPLSDLGVSNMTSGNIVRVSVENGTLVVYVPTAGADGYAETSARAGGGVPCGS